MELIGEAECAKFYCIQRKSDRYDPSHTNIVGAHFVANIIASELSKAKTPLAEKINKKRLWPYKLTVKAVIPPYKNKKNAKSAAVAAKKSAGSKQNKQK